MYNGFEAFDQTFDIVFHDYRKPLPAGGWMGTHVCTASKEPVQKFIGHEDSSERSKQSAANKCD